MDNKMIAESRRSAALGMWISAVLGIVLTIVGIQYLMHARSALANGRWAPDRLTQLHKTIAHRTTANKAGKLADLFVGTLQKDGKLLRRDLVIFSALLAVIVAQSILCFVIARRLRNVTAQLASDSVSFTVP